MPFDERRRPAELFGYPLEDNSSIKALKSRKLSCPFTSSECIKKTHYAAESGKVSSSGICSVWYNGAVYITCSKRQFQENLIFKHLGNLIFRDKNPIVIPEVGINPYGRFDFVIAEYDETKKAISDFFGTEIVSIDTTSTRGLNEAVSDRLKNKLSEKYKFGLNFEHTAKLMITQLILKGSILEKWKKKYIWILQDSFYGYLTNLIDFNIHEYSPRDSIVFYLTKIQYDKERKSYVLKEAGIKSCRVKEFRDQITAIEGRVDYNDFLKKITQSFHQKMKEKEQTSPNAFSK